MTTPLDAMAPLPRLHLDNAVDTLARTPRVLRALVAGVSAVLSEANEGPDSWSPHIVVAHLVYCERHNWMPRATVLRDYGLTAQFPPFSPDGQFNATLAADGTGPLLVEASLDTLLDAFEAARADGLATLTGWQLRETDLRREGVHPVFGRVTLQQLLAAWVAHDLAHIAQITRVLAKQYGDMVGPWRPMLRLLDR